MGLLPVETVKDGSDALDVYKNAMETNEVIDVVIMDLTIPGGMGAEEAIKGLFKIDPYVKTIICSGYTNNPVMIDYRKYGFLGRLSKPFKVDELKEVLNDVITIDDKEFV